MYFRGAGRGVRMGGGGCGLKDASCHAHASMPSRRSGCPHAFGAANRALPLHEMGDTVLGCQRGGTQEQAELGGSVAASPGLPVASRSCRSLLQWGRDFCACKHSPFQRRRFLK